MTIHPAQLRECESPACVALNRAWEALQRAREVGFDEFRPIAWELEFRRDAEVALAAFDLHESESDGSCGMRPHPEGEAATAAQPGQHARLREILSALVAWSADSASSLSSQHVVACRDAAVTGQLQLVLHHWSIAQATRPATDAAGDAGMTETEEA